MVYWPMLEYSRKPEVFQTLIAGAWPEPAESSLELFARRARAGWDVAGFEADGEERRELKKDFVVDFDEDAITAGTVKGEYSGWVENQK